MPATTFADGPTSGRFAGANPYGTNLPPYAARQPVQGFSGVLCGPGRDAFRLLVDNGFGAKLNSADALLRMYTLTLDLRTRAGGTGTVSAADWASGRPRSAFDSRTRITLNDASRLLGLPIQADYSHYYDNPAGIPVDAAVREGRLLTGADLDVESVRRDHRGNYWFGDEFGPYLVKTDARGTVPRPAITLPGVHAPENAAVAAGAASANLGGSGGFEGMAINASGTRLYTLLEKTVAGDPAKRLRTSEFDIDAESYTGAARQCRARDSSPRAISCSAAGRACRASSPRRSSSPSGVNPVTTPSSCRSLRSRSKLSKTKARSPNIVLWRMVSSPISIPCSVAIVPPTPTN